MNNPIESRITEFIQEHHLLTLATSVDNTPYCASCFYTYIEEDNMFVFTSDIETKHGADLIQNKKAAATVALETKTVGKIRGIQITGQVEKLEGDIERVANKAYLKKFPYAILKKTTLWGLAPEYIKMTDNRLGFGKKIIWQRN